jgi:hypothetical protein
VVRAPARGLSYSQCGAGALRLQGTSPSQLGQRTEVISLPGPAGRALSAGTAADLSDRLFFLALACCSPLPPGPLPLLPFVLRYPCAGAAAAVAPLAGAFSTTSSPGWRAFRLSALTCFSFIRASYSSWPWRTYVIPCFSAW